MHPAFPTRATPLGALAAILLGGCQATPGAPGAAEPPSATPRSAALGGEAPDWRYPRGPREGTLRVGGVGEIAGDAFHQPSLLWEVPGATTSVLPRGTLLFDVDPSDPAPELVVVHRGALMAVDPETDTTLWRTPGRLLGAVLGPYDVDGDGIAAEAIATSSDPGGGIWAVSLTTGGLFTLGADFPQAAGVYAYETVVGDFDGVPGDEAFFDLAFTGSLDLYLVDAGTGLASPSRLAQSFTGYDTLHEVIAGRMRPDEGVGFAFMLRESLGYMWTCGATDPGASCTGYSDLCLCGPVYYGATVTGSFDPSREIWDDYSFGYQEVRDVDGDGVEEHYVVSANTVYETSVSLLDIGEADPEGTTDVSQVVRWQIRYSACATRPKVYAPAQGLVDLDGDGALEAVLSIYDDPGCSTDREGHVGVDGIDADDAWSVLVLDATSGAVVATLPASGASGHYAVGTHDFDGDGLPEVLARPYDGESGLDETRAFRLDCGGGACALVEAWGLASAYPLSYLTPRKLPSRLDRGYTRDLAAGDLTGDGVDDLLVADADRLGVLDPTTGAVSAWWGREACPDLAEVHFAGGASRVVMTAADCIAVLDGSLAEVAPGFDLPPQTTPAVLLASPAPGQPAALLSGKGFYTHPETGLPDHVFEDGSPALLTDLDADGAIEVVWIETDRDGQWFRVHVDEHDPGDADADGTPFARAWTFDSALDPTLDSYTQVLVNLVIEGDLDDAPGRDLAFVAIKGASTGDVALLVLDGASGAESWRAWGSSGSSINAGLTLGAVDVGSAAGYGVLDGVEDVVYTTNYFVNVYTAGMEVPLLVYQPTGTVWGTEALFADLDGDGDVDQLMVRNIDSALNALRAHDLAGPGIDDLWEDVDPGPRSSSFLSTALAAIDGTPGADVLFAGGYGGLGAWNGADGVPLPGFPVYLQDGGLLTETSPGARAVRALAVADVDGDGFDEALVGGEDGWVYAVDVVQAEVGAAPALVWSYYVGSAVRSVRGGDVDGDGSLEVVVGSEDGSARAIDASPASLEIDWPTPGLCVGEPDLLVRGVASAIEEACVSVGLAVAGCGDAASGSWSVAVTLPGPGTYDAVATGLVAGEEVAYDVVTVHYSPDGDGDGWLACDGDCNDADPTVHPGAPELCDGLDNDCDGTVLDEDSADADGDGWRVCAGDCDDADPAVHPGAPEVCNGVDDDCDGAVDDDHDADGDGFSPCAGDCDDADASVYPGAPEVCDGVADNDCDGLADPDELDGDGDGVAACEGDCRPEDGAVRPGAPETCDGRDNDCDETVDEGTECFDDDGDGLTEVGGDCDDADAAVRPGGAEVCDGVDQDCDGLADEGTECHDDDGDGYDELGGDCNDGDPAVHPGAEEVLDGVDGDCDGLVDGGLVDVDGDGTTASAGDCDDQDPTAWPGAPEQPDGMDDDCDGLVDEGTELYDDDGDGFAEADGDCDDADPGVHPGATEEPNGRDDDCDGGVDENTDRSDDDGDGYSELGGDCDDAEPDVHPGAPEEANGRDDDCDGKADEGTTLWDDDEDGSTEADGDCDDADPAAHPGGVEVADGVDNDCDGEIDEGLVPRGEGGTGCACDGGGGSAPPTGAGFAAAALAGVALGRRSRRTSRRGAAVRATALSAAIAASFLQGCTDTALGSARGDLNGSQDRLDFGLLATGSYAELEIWVHNAGSGTLVLEDVEVEAEAGTFTAEWTDGAVLYALGEATPVRVSYHPSAAGDHAGSLRILAAEGRGEFLVSLQGYARDARVSGWPEVVDLGAVIPGTTAQGRIGLVNEGVVAVSLSPGEAPETASGVLGLGTPPGGWPLSLGPGGVAELGVTYAAVDAGAVDLPLTFVAAGAAVPPVEVRVRANDCDGTAAAVDLDGDGISACAGDCDDTDAGIRPGAAETCDGADGDCDGSVDEGTECSDDDGDGYDEGDGDCRDGDPAVNPGAEEVENGLDDDCDGVVDDGTGATDDDGDGYAEVGGDCDDGDPSAHPHAPEEADGVDDDCDGLVDEGTAAFDDDGDGYCEGPGCSDGSIPGDCNDALTDMSPGSVEAADGRDNDCDGTVDDGTEWYDDDGDGYTEAGGDPDDGDASVP